MNRRFLEVNLRVIGTANDSNSTTDGDQFIVGANPAGNFAGAKKNDLAQRVDGAWVFYTPWYDNIEIMDMEAGKWKRFDGTNWVEYSDIGGDASVPDASYTEKGKVVIAKTGGLKIVDGSVALGRAMVTQKIELDAGMASSKEVVLAKHVVAGLENDVTLSACGVMQVPADDFKIVEFEESGAKKSRLYWGGLGLDELGLVAGDVIVVSYQTDAV